VNFAKRTQAAIKDFFMTEYSTKGCIGRPCNPAASPRGGTINNGVLRVGSDEIENGRKIRGHGPLNP
jgi:hypothetical protein